MHIRSPEDQGRPAPHSPESYRPVALERSRALAIACVAAALAGPSPAHAGKRRVVLEIGTQAIDGSRYMRDMRAFARDVEERTRGRVRIRWRPNGELGDEPRIAGLVESGELDGAALSDAGLSELVPEMRAFQYPALFRDYAEVDAAFEKNRGRLVELFADEDLVLLMWADLGFAHVFSARPIASLADQRKTSIWMDPGERGAAHAAELLGLPTRVVATRAKLLDDIGNRRASAWVMPPLYAIALGTARSAGYVWSLRFRYVVGGLVVRKQAWAGLSRKQQRQVREVCAEWEPRLRKRWRRETRNGIRSLPRLGLRVLPVSEADATAFRAAAAQRRRAFAEEWNASALMEALTGEDR